MKIDTIASTSRQTSRRPRQRPVPLIILRGHTTSISALTFLSPSSSSSSSSFLSDDFSPWSPPLLASADELGAIRVWDLRYEECVLTVRSASNLNHDAAVSPAVDPVISVLYDPVSTSLYAQYKSGRLTATDLEHDTMQQQQQQASATSSLLTDTPKLAQSFCRMACVSSAPLLLAAPADGVLSPLSSSSSSALSTGMHNDANFILFDPRSASPVTMFTPGSCSPLSRKQFGILLSLCAVPPTSLTGVEPSTATSASSDGVGGVAMIAAGYEGGALALWDVRSPGKFLTATATSSAFSAAASLSSSCRSTNRSSHTPPSSKPSTSSSTALLSVVCHPRGHVLAAAGASPYVHAFGLFNGINNVDGINKDQAIQSPLRLRPLAHTHHAHPSSRSTSHDHDKASSGKQKQSPQQHEDVGVYENSQHGVSQVCWTPDGRALLAAGWDGGVRVCDGRRRAQCLLQPVTTLRWHDGSVTCVDCVQQQQQGYGRSEGEGYEGGRWLPSSMIATGGRDTTVAVWDGCFSSK